MREGRRSILLDEEMAGPRKCVAGHQRNRKKPPFTAGNRHDQKRYCQQGAKAMHYASSRFAVLTQIVGPKIGKRFEPSFIHGKRRRRRRYGAF